MKVHEIVTKIQQLYVALKNNDCTTEETASTINDILLHEKEIRKEDLVSAWEEFARKKGVNC